MSSCTVTIESNGILAHISTHDEEFIIEVSSYELGHIIVTGLTGV